MGVGEYGFGFCYFRLMLGINSYKANATNLLNNQVKKHLVPGETVWKMCKLLWHKDGTDAALHVCISFFASFVVGFFHSLLLYACAGARVQCPARAHIHVVLIFHIISFALGEVIFAEEIAWNRNFVQLCVKQRENHSCSGRASGPLNEWVSEWDRTSGKLDQRTWISARTLTI